MYKLQTFNSLEAPLCSNPREADIFMEIFFIKRNHFAGWEVRNLKLENKDHPKTYYTRLRHFNVLILDLHIKYILKLFVNFQLMIIKKYSILL